MKYMKDKDMALTRRTRKCDQRTREGIYDWPEFRRFSEPLTGREKAVRAVLLVVVSGFAAAALIPQGNQTAPEPVAQVRYVTLPRVTITAKREAPAAAGTAAAANRTPKTVPRPTSPGASALRLVKGSD